MSGVCAMRGRRRLSLFSRIAMPLGLVIFAFAWIALNVTAASSPFKISDATITNKTGGVDATINGFEDTKINSSATFYQVNGSITYAVTLQNTTDKNFKISAITDDNSNPYLAYSYASHAGEEVAAGGNLKLDVTVTYVNNIPDPEARIQNFDVKFLLGYEEIAEEPTEDDEDIVVPDTNDDTVVPDTGANPIEKSGAKANPAFVTAAIIGAVVMIYGLVRSKLDIKTKAIILAVFGTLATMTVTNAVSANFTFEIANEINLKDLLYVTSEVNGVETKSVVNYGGTLSLVTPQKTGYTFAGWQDENGNPFNPATPITDDAKIKAVFTVDNYAISYDLNGGTTATGNATSYTINDSITLVEPTKDHYNFAGWTGTDLTEPTKNVVIATGSTGNREYTANYTPVDYRITYDNITPEELVLMYNPTSYNIETASFTLRNPETRRDGDGDATEIFIGWNDGGTISNTVTLPNASSMGNKNYVAVWEPVSSTVYTITYNLNGGTTATANRTEFTKETESFTLVNPTKLGYQFKGWSGTGLTGDENLEVTVAQHTRQNLEFEAHYTPNTYNVIFDGNTGAGTMNSQTLTYDQAANLTANAFTKTGHHFVSWNTAADGSGSAYTDGEEVENLKTEGEITLFAQWEANTYEIIFDGNHANLIGTMDNFPMVYGETKALPLNMFGVLGSAFDSWNTRADGSGDKYNNGSMVTNLAEQGTVTLYAQWAVTPYTVIYDKNSNEATGTMASQEIAYGVPENLLANGFTRTGYTFMGWNTEANGTGDHYDDQQRVINLDIDGIVNLYAEWRANTYEIAFDKNAVEATGEMANLDMSYATAANLTANAFERTGYTFEGWNTQPNGGGTPYADGASVNNLTTTDGDVITLYAQWLAAPYTIVFHANDAEATGSMEDLTARYMTPIELPANSFVKTGWIFTGWNTKADGSGTPIADKETVVNLSTGNTVDLYAQWRLAVAQFKPGLYVNNQMRVLSNSGIGYGKSLTNDTPMSNNSTYQDSTKILAIKRSATPPDFDHMNVINPWAEGSEGYNPDFEKLNDWNIVSTANSLDPIYIWYVPNDANNTNGILYYWSADVDPQLNANSYRMFRTLSNVAEIDYQYFDTTGVENIREMFSNTKITSADLSHFDTSHLVEMRSLFSNCTALTGVTFGNNFDTSQVQYFSNIFANNRALTGVDISMFDTRNAISMAGMFSGTNVLTSINYGENFKTDNVRDFSSMYNGALVLPDLEIVKTFNTSSATNMDSMFKNCQAITEIDVTGFNTANVTDMGSMFMNLKNISSLDIQNFDTRNVEDMSYLFRGLKNITTHPLVGENFKTTSLKDMHGMYRDYSDNLTSIDLTGYDTSHVTDMSELFMENPQLTSLNITSFTTSEVANFSYMFDHCSGLRAVPEVATFDTANATDMAGMFRGMKVQSLDLSNFNTEKVRSMAFMFNGFETETDLDFSSFSTPALTNLDTTFQTFKTPYKLDLSTFNTENVTIFQYLFKSIDAPYIDISNFNMSSFTNCQQMFHGMTNEILDIGKFETNGRIISGQYLMSHSTTKTVLVTPDYEPNFGDVLDLTGIVGGQGTTYMGYSGVYGRIDHAEDGGEPGYFTDKSKLTIKYHLNSDSEYAGGAMETQNTAGGVDVTLSPNQYYWTGYAFGGWNTKADLSGIHYDDQQVIRSYGTLHLYAEWGKTPYTVTFNKNSEEAVGEAIAPEVREYGEWFTLPANTFTWTDHRFLGWNTKADGTGKHYDDEERVINLDVDGTVELFAEWHEIVSVFDTGTAVRRKLAAIANDDASTITKIKRYTAGVPDTSGFTSNNTLSHYSSPDPIYGWFDNGTIYYWSEDPHPALNRDAQKMFQALKNVTEIDITTLDTSNTESIALMFNGDTSLTEIDLSNFNATKLVSMQGAFQETGLTSVDLSNFNTPALTNMASVFFRSKSIESITFGPNFNTSNVTDMSMLFMETAVTELDLSMFNTGSVRNMYRMFRDCGKLEEIDFGNNFDTSNVTTMGEMFWYNKALKELDLSTWHTSNVTNLGNMFVGSASLTSLTFGPYFDTSNVTSMDSMFRGLDLITSLDISMFNTGNVKSMANMFLFDRKLEELKFGPNFTTNNVTTMQGMFEYCSSLKELDLSTFDTHNVTKMGYMFLDDTELEVIYATENFVADQIVETIDNDLPFRNNRKLVGGMGTKYTDSRPNPRSAVYAHIDGGVDNQGYLTDKTKLNIFYHINADDATGTMTDQIGLQANTDSQLNANQYIRLGYTFGGWNTKADGSGVHYDDGQIVNTYGKLDLYAEWGLTPYTVHFDKNAGDAVGTMADIVKEYGEHFDLPANTFTREGYVFKGWNMKADGTGRHYNDQENVINLDDDRDATLYAEWAENQATFAMGENVNKAMRRLSGSGTTGDDNIITTFTRAQSAPDFNSITYETVSADGSVAPIYMWFNNGTIYWYSDARKIYLNENSQGFFSNLRSLATADVSAFDTSNVSNLSMFFYGTNSLTSVDIRNWDTGNVTSMKNMFALGDGNSSLTTLLFPTNFNTSNVRDMSGFLMLQDKITSLDVSGWNTSNVNNMNSMFRGCAGLTSITFGGSFDVSNVQNMGSMFAGDSGLTTLDLSTWNTSSLTNISSTFISMSSIETIYVSDTFDLSHITKSGYEIWGSGHVVGGAGTIYIRQNNHLANLVIDDPDGGHPGYFSLKGARYIRYDGNTADGGDAMTSGYVTNTDNLKTNTYTKTGYHFVGWAESADGAKVYDDGQLMSGITESKTPLKLYAVWEQD